MLSFVQSELPFSAALQESVRLSRTGHGHRRKLHAGTLQCGVFRTVIGSVVTGGYLSP
jgi:hypothetical protein